jgi:hypothetical protein
MFLILLRFHHAGYATEEPTSASAPFHLPRGSVEHVFHVDDDVLLNACGGFDEYAEGTLGGFERVICDLVYMCDK